MLPHRLRIRKVVKENEQVKTFIFEGRMIAEPGQFVMVWLPGVGERPMSIACDDPFALSIAAVGPWSRAAHKLKAGDSMWVRGPYGNCYRLKGRKALVVGGGYGVAPLRFLCLRANAAGMKGVFVMGARNKSLLMSIPHCEHVITTDDGSAGMKGRATDALEMLLKKGKYDCVYTCGPEKMMRAVVALCEKYGTPYQVSIERYMKCGFGICGQCAINGALACYDGTIFDDVKGFEEFGKCRRDSCGKKIVD
ncbi:Sulfhydrogenase 1 subunit gamma [Candidatus Burarchaeum australiense]|nr:Sulfhydrogenase 1 subunit gamma [Candidatus Burarchaeum australiense]